jgi:putative drug exporter of the RND superfamily
VGIDYALFVVSRYRAALHAGSSPQDAVVTAMTTAGRAVMFAGSTVVPSLLGLFLLGLPGPGSPATVAALREDMVRQPDVASVSPPVYSPDRTAAVLTVIPRTSPRDALTSTLVRHLRDDVVPRAVGGTGAVVLIGGQTAAAIDTAGLISARLLAVVLLMAAFRSVVIPAVSALATLLSTGAAYGVMVAVFQWGWLGGGIDNGATAPVDP